MPSAFFLSLLPLPFKAALVRPHVGPTGEVEPYTIRRGLATCFAIHGRHVAANQIRVLIICSIVMTTLLYPALAIHYETVSASANPSATDRPPSLAGTPLLRPLFSAGGRAADAEAAAFPWPTGSSGLDGLDGWLLVDGSLSQQQQLEPAVRLETVWVGDVADLRNPPSVAFKPDAQALARRIMHQNTTLPDLIHCYLPSPSDSPWAAVTCAFGASSNQSMWNNAAWLGAIDGAFDMTPHAIYGRSAAVTTRCEAHNALSLPSDASRSSISTPGSANHPLPSHPILFLARSLLPVPILALYTFLFVWTFRSLQRFTQVHNRLGVAFTYVVELAASTTCSGSLCVMLGWKLEGVPWFLLPFVITVVGVENMVHVTNAIVTTPVHMTVRERLGLGLAHAGPRITFTTLADILILALVGMVAGETAGIIKEFCRFAILVLIADWFLLFTFFTTVISIDMQRLELADVLRQGTPVVPVAPLDSTSSMASVSADGHTDVRPRRRRRGKPATKSSSEVLVSGFQAILRARTARNGSLMALMGLLLGLWYFYEGGLSAQSKTPGVGAEGGRLLVADGPFDPTALWRHVNPSGLRSISLTLPAPIAVVVSTDASQPRPATYLASVRAPLRSVFSDRAPIAWFIQVVFLPIAATTSIVYVILRFLLKDAELLDAQRDRLELGEEWDDSEGELGGAIQRQPTLRMLPTAHQADISLLATSTTKLLSIGFDGIALVWDRDDPTSEGLPLPLDLQSDRATLTALDGPGRFCAVATAKGAVRVWLLGSRLIQPTLVICLAAPGSPSSAISSIAFLPSSSVSTSGGLTTAPVASLVIVRENGELAEIKCRNAAVVIQRPASSTEAVRATPLWTTRVTESSAIDLALATSEGQVRILRRDTALQTWIERVVIEVEPSQRVSRVASTKIFLGGQAQDVFAVTTTSGVISLWDSQGLLLITVNPNLRKLGRVALVDSGVQECVGCGQKLDGFLLLASNTDKATFYRITADSVAAAMCACPAMRRSMSSSTQRTSFDRLSFDSSPLVDRSGRGSGYSPAVPPISPTLHRRLPTSFSNASNLSADYPIAGHGVHSRRLSTRDRRAEAEEHLLGPDDGLAGADDPFTASSSPEDGSPNGPSRALRAILLGSMPVRKGGWDVLDSGLVVGVGRTSRYSSSQDDSASVKSATSSTSGGSAARWRVWQIDSQRPSHGHDLDFAAHEIDALREESPFDGADVSPDDQLPGGSRSSSEASAFRRRRRAARVRAFSRQKTTIAPSLAHSVISPLVGVGAGVVFAGRGNALCRLNFPSTAACTSAPTPAPSMLQPPQSQLSSPSSSRTLFASPEVRRR